ncbi:MAG TPA: sugar ABC transporter permease, partial [Devosia sp.]|nr:sugar ABC transporter permease [Devosia sp.]
MNNVDKQQQLLDRADSRLKHEAGIGGAIRAFLDRVRSGDLGALPVVVGLVVIWTVFATLNPIFLSSTNLVNLLFDSSTVGVIALGVVLMLMVGEIDLSIGSVSGFASAMLGVLWVNQGWPVALAILAAVAVGGVVGYIYAQLYNRFGMPSFVATLAGLLAVLGMQLYILGGTGSINLPYGSPLVNFGQLLTMPAVVAYGFAALPGIAILITGYRTAARRREAGLSSRSLGGVLFTAIVVTVALELAVAYLNTSRGVPWMFGLFVVLVVGMNYALT